MKIKTLIALAAASLVGVTAQAQEITVARQVMNLAGRLIVDSANGNTTSIVRISQRDFIDVVALDAGLVLEAAELRTSRLVTFDLGSGLVGLFIEYRDAETREWVLFDVTDRFFINLDSDISGNDATSGGRWAAVMTFGIDLDDGIVGDEFSGTGIFQAAVRTLRGRGNSIMIPTAGFRSVQFPAILYISVEGVVTESSPAAMTLALRTQVDRIEDPFLEL